MGKAVLVVDDDALFRAFLGEGLRAIGYKVGLAGNGMEGLQTQTPYNRRRK